VRELNSQLLLQVSSNPNTARCRDSTGPTWLRSNPGPLRASRTNMLAYEIIKYGIKTLKHFKQLLNKTFENLLFINHVKMSLNSL
jgi:hypothetical protein